MTSNSLQVQQNVYSEHFHKYMEGIIGAERENARGGDNEDEGESGG